MKRIAGVAVMAAFMSLSLVGVATAHTVKYDSTITFQVKKNGQDADTFEGKVGSQNDKCVADREVLFFVVIPSGDQEIGSTTTDSDGNYSAPAYPEPGTFYAVVTRKVLRNSAEHTHVCKKDVSPERVVAGSAN
jgi:hypothetical protein